MHRERSLFMTVFSDHTMLSRLRFALTTMFHINRALLSIGLSLFLVVTAALMAEDQRSGLSSTSPFLEQAVPS